MVSYEKKTEGVFQLFRPNSNWTTLESVSLPSGWNLQAQSKDLLFMVSGSKLYRFNKYTYNVEQLYSLPVKDNYTIYGWGDRVVVSMFTQNIYDSSSFPVIYSSDYQIYVLHYKGNGTSLVAQMSINGVKENSVESLKLAVSPNVTKILIPYENVNGTKGLIAKNIDFNQDSARDMTFENRNDFENFVSGVNVTSEICMGDNYMVIRNGSKFRMNNLQNRALEIGYQFINDKVTFLKERDVSLNIPVNGSYN